MTSSERQLSTTVLVIGTGGSGLRAAIELAEAGVDVLALGKRPKSDAHTSLAAGGINAALATMDEEDTWQQHAADTLKESYLLANPETVEVVTKGAARGIDDLERYGMPFAREDDGRISQRFFGAHTYRRTAFAGDYTGLEIQRTLINRAAQLQVPILDTVYVTRILVNEDGAVFGAYGFDLEDGTRYLIHADAVILAAAGLRRIGRAEVVTEFLDADAWPTAPGQGALAVEVRRGDEDLVRALDHAETRAAVEAERGVLALLEAGCSAPVGARAVVDAGLLLLSASVYSLDGTTILTSSHGAVWPDDADSDGVAPRDVAAAVARELLAAGAADLTQERP